MGRYITGLRKLDEVNTLLKYLYLSEEHYIEFKNEIGGIFQLKMRDDGNLARVLKNGPIPDFEVTDNNMDHMFLFAVIDQLKEQPATLYPERFQNRWLEIKDMCWATLGFNYLNQEKINN